MLVIIAGLSSLLDDKYEIKIQEIILLAIVIFTTIILRHLSQVFIDTQPTADFLNAINIAEKFSEGFYPDLRSARFPYWGFFKLTLSPLLKVISRPETLTNTLNLILSGLTTIGIYFLGKLTSDSKKFAIVSATIFTLFPADILYKNLPTGEHIFIMLLPYTIILFISLQKKEEVNFIHLLGFILVGSLLGLMDLYRPVAIILWITFVLSIIVFKMVSGHYERIFFRESVFWFYILIVLFLTIGFFSIKNIGFFALKQRTGYPPNRSGIGWTLRIGLDVERGGTWNREIYDRMIDLYANNNENYEKVNQILLSETKEILEENRSDIFMFIGEKFTYTWKSTYDFFHWATVDRSSKSKITTPTETLEKFILPLSDVYWVSILIFSCIGSIYCAKHQPDVTIIIIELFVLGVAFMLIITETQQRYLSVLHSSLPILTAYGLQGFNKFVKNTLNKIGYGN